MDSAMGTFAQCRVLNNRGPGLDISSSSRVSAKECTISQNVGERKEAPSYALQCKTAWLSLQMHALRNMSSFGTSLILECFARSFVITSLAAKRALQICAALAYPEDVGKCSPSRMMLCHGSAMFCWDVLACEATKSKPLSNPNYCLCAACSISLVRSMDNEHPMQEASGFGILHSAMLLSHP